jgi:hypothetical protein
MFFPGWTSMLVTSRACRTWCLLQIRHLLALWLCGFHHHRLHLYQTPATCQLVDVSTEYTRPVPAGTHIRLLVNCYPGLVGMRLNRTE